MDRLGGQDAAFLAFEAPGRPMHVGLLAVPEMSDGPRGEAARWVRDLGARLVDLPLLRKRLAARPGRWLVPRAPRWVVAAPEVDAHVRVVALGGPLDSESGRKTLAELFWRPLDLGRPPWEAWILADPRGRCAALLVKAHHALLDGSAGLAALAAVLDGLGALAAREPAPVAVRRAPRASAWRGLAALAARLLRPGTDSSLNGPNVPGSGLSTLVLDESMLRAVGRSQGASTHDALLAVVSGALRRWLEACGRETDRVRLRALCPVDRRGPEGPGASGESSGEPSGNASGNRLGGWLLDLPVAEPDPARRLAAIRARTDAARRRDRAAGVELLGRLARFAPDALLRRLVAWTGRLRAFGIVVTHVVGPAAPATLLGTRLASLAALAPVFAGQRCSIAAFRYAGRVHVGVTGAFEDPAEVERIAAALHEELEAWATVLGAVGSPELGTSSRPVRTGATQAVAAGGERATWKTDPVVERAG